MATGIHDWLTEIGLAQYTAVFADNDLDLDLVADLADQDLKDLGVASMGHRKRLVRAIEALTAAGPVADASDAALVAAPEPAANLAGARADRRQLTVMFCDLVDSTALSARLDAEDYRDVMRAYQDACAGVVTRYDGFVARYMGDGVLAYFGWPRSHEDDAERAVNAGLGVVDAVRDIAPPKGEPAPLAVRVGIATGAVIVGDIIGEGASQEAAVTGETPNLAARLQQIAMPHSVVVSAGTRSLVRELFAYDNLGPLDLKGIGQEVDAWRVVGVKHVDSRFEAVRGQSLSSFIGRDHELGLLRDRWEQACNSEGQVLLLSGEAGIGKSRLTQALMEHVQPSAHFRLRFQCSPYDASSAFKPFVRQLERAACFQSSDSVDTRVSKLGNLLRRSSSFSDEGLALLANLLRLPVESHAAILSLTPQQSKQRTLKFLADQVFALAAIKSTLFLFEDAHWIDPSSLELLTMIAARASAAPLLVAITQRPEWHAPFADLPNVALLQLNRLGRRQITAIIRSIAATEIPNALIEKIIERTDGIPLFVEEMTRSLIEGGFAGAAHSANGIPDTLQASLTAGLDRLPSAAKELAQVASVIGREIPLPLLVRVSGGTQADITVALQELLQSQLLLHGTSSDERQVSFRHALIRDAAYQSLLISRRREIHRRIAEALEADFAQTVELQPELVARHYAEADEPQCAIPYWRRAAERAIELVASREAVDHFENALAQLALTTPGADRDRLELDFVLAMGVPLIAATGYASAEVRHSYERARELSNAVRDNDSLFVSTRGLWNCVYDCGELEQALELAESLVRSSKGSDIAKTALAQRALGSVQLNRAAFDDAIAAFDRCLSIVGPDLDANSARDHGEAPQVIAQQYKGWAKVVQGRMDEARHLAQGAVSRAREIGHPLTLTFSLQILSIVQLLCREYGACQVTATETMAVSREHDFVFWSAGSKVLLGCAEAHLGDGVGNPTNALETAAQGLRDWQSTGAALHVPTWSSFIADAALRVGDLNMAERVTDSGLALAHANHDLIAVAELQRLQGVLAVRGGNFERGQRQLETAIVTAATQGAGLFGLRAAIDLAHLHIKRGDAGEARTILGLALDAITEGLDTVDVCEARGLLGA